MWRWLVNASAIALLLMSAWGAIQLVRTPRGSPMYRSIRLRTAGAFLAGASRFVPDAYEIPFFMLMAGAAMILLSGSPRKPTVAP